MTQTDRPRATLVADSEQAGGLTADGVVDLALAIDSEKGAQPDAGTNLVTSSDAMQRPTFRVDYPPKSIGDGGSAVGAAAAPIG